MMKTLIAALLAAAVAAPAAFAQPWGGGEGGPRGHGPAIDFDAIDTEGTGALDRAALEAYGTERLSALDLDGDGMLDREELAAAMPGREPSPLFAFAPDRTYAHADRVLEMLGAGEAGAVPVEAVVRRQVDMLFARLDRDGDGTISREEAERAMERRGMAGRMMRGHGRP